MPEWMLSFLRATLAPAALRRPVEELLVRPFITKLADKGHAAWVACAPVVAAHVEVKRIMKKFNVDEKRSVAERELV